MYHPPRFHENIQLGPYRYELYFNGHSVNLAYRNSSIGTQRRADGGLLFWGDEDNLVYHDLELNTDAFALAARILPVLAHRMAELQPLEFSLAANSKRKIKPYQRFAKRLHRYLCHLYDIQLTKDGARFEFNKQPKAKRTNLPLPPEVTR